VKDRQGEKQHYVFLRIQHRRVNTLLTTFLFSLFSQKLSLKCQVFGSVVQLMSLVSKMLPYLKSSVIKNVFLTSIGGVSAAVSDT